MTIAAEYRDYAKQCMRWASKAETGEELQAYLSMARQWLQAAFMIEMVEGRSTPAAPSAPSPLTRH
jgi:hypothetical protein